MISSNGANWVEIQVAPRTDVFDIAEKESGLMAVGRSGWSQTSSYISGAIFASADALAWERRDRGFHGLLDDVTYGGGKFVAVGSVFSATPIVVVSTNGSDWARADLVATNTLHRVAYGNGTYVIIARQRSAYPPTPIYTSTDALTWTRHNDTTNIATFLTGITFGAGKFVAVGPSNTVAYSTDGRAWQSRSLHDHDLLSTVAFGNNLFVAVGNKSRATTNFTDNILTSPDGITWTRQTTGHPAARIELVAFGNGRFVAVAETNTFTSTDGVNWETHSFTNRTTSEKLLFGHGLFVMPIRSRSPGSEGFYDVLSSRDGVNWTVHQTGSTLRFFSGAFGANTFVVASDAGGILQSDPFSDLARLMARYISASNSVELSVSSSSAGPMRIQRTSDLSSAPWESFGTLNPGSTLLDTPTAARKFYRGIAVE